MVEASVGGVGAGTTAAETGVAVDAAGTGIEASEVVRDG